MPSLRVPALKLRVPNGAVPLTHAEVDGDFTILKDFSNTLADVIGVSLNPDGTIKPGAVPDDGIPNRSITAANMSFTSALFGVDTGTAGNIVVAFTPPMTAYADKTVLFIKVAATNAGVTTIRVDGLAAVQLIKRGGEPLVAGDVNANGVICVAYYGGYFHLVGSVTSGSTGGGSGGSSSIVFDQQIALPGNGLDAVFAHGLGVVPENYSVYLICNHVAGDAGYAFGERIPIGQAVDSVGAPAFSVTTSSANVTVTQLTAGVEVPDIVSPPGNVPIDETRWQIKVVITQVVTSTLTMTPALEIFASYPTSAIGYGKYLWFIMGYGKLLIMLDTSTGIVLRKVTYSPVHLQANMTQFISDDKNSVIFASENGLFRFNLDGVFASAELGTHGGIVNYAPVEMDEDTAPAAPATPDIYAVDLATNSEALHLRKLTTHGGDPAGNTDVGAVTLHNAGIANIAEFNLIEGASNAMRMFAYNPIKKRIYVVTKGLGGNNVGGLLHIFKITNATLRAWWVDASKYDNIIYEKAIAIGGGAATSDATPGYEKLAVEFDLITGQERSVSFTRYAKAGAVIRVPWMEG